MSYFLKMEAGIVAVFSATGVQCSWSGASQILRHGFHFRLVPHAFQSSFRFLPLIHGSFEVYYLASKYQNFSELYIIYF